MQWKIKVKMLLAKKGAILAPLYYSFLYLLSMACPQLLQRVHSRSTGTETVLEYSEYLAPLDLKDEPFRAIEGTP